MRTYVLALLAVLFTAASLFSTHSAEQNRGTNAPVTPGQKAQLPRGMPFYGKVGAIDKQAQTITLDGKEKVRLFYITSATRIHRDKKPAKLDDAIIGQWVGGFVRPDAEGRPTVVTLNLAVAQPKSSSLATNSVPRKAAQPK